MNRTIPGQKAEAFTGPVAGRAADQAAREQARPASQEAAAQSLTIVVSPGGELLSVYDEQLPLAALGAGRIRRASQVEPDEAGQWWANLAPVGGPRLGPYGLRSAALAAERQWLGRHMHQLSPAAPGQLPELPAG